MTSDHSSLLNNLINCLRHDFNLQPDNPFLSSLDRYSDPPSIPGIELVYDVYVGKNVFYSNNSREFIHSLFSLDTYFIVDKNAYTSFVDFFDLTVPSQNIIFSDNLSCKQDLDSLLSLVADCSFFVALGSGYLQDVCKYIQHITSVQCLLIPSALSTHVFASNFIHAHPILHEYGLQKSLKSDKIFISFLLGDFLEMTHMHFPRLLKSGLADVYALRTATIEWQYGPQYLASNAHMFAVLLSHKSISLLLSFSKAKVLLDLILSQVLLNVITEVVGSPPASGTEHLYANTIEKYYCPSEFHGELVARGILLQLSILDIFPESSILTEMNSLNILPVSSLSYTDLDQTLISKMINLSVLKKRFTILSMVA